MNSRTILILSGAGLLGFACGTERLNAGSSGDRGVSLDAGEPTGIPYVGTPSNSFDVKCDLAAPDWIAGTWQGELDTYTLPSGSRSMQIEFTGSYQEPDGLCGTVTFGQGSPPPVATDPEAPPPGHLLPFTLEQIIEGFPYEFFRAGTSPFDGGATFPPAVEGQRVRFGITLRQVYKSWCNLQLAYLQEPLPKVENFNPLMRSPNYRCLPPDTFSGPGGVLCDAFDGLTIQHVSCAQAEYCSVSVCDCMSGLSSFVGTAETQGCTVQPGGSTTFDLSLAGATLSGNVVLTEGVEGMHLTRAP